METTFDYLRQFGPLLAERILETYPPLQSTKDPIAPALATLSRKALPAQALAVTGTAKYLRKAKAARIVAECGAGKTFMALGTIHVLAEGRSSTTLVMCPSHITHKWAREVLLTIPRARTFLIEDMRNGGDPSRPHGICEVKLSKGRTVYEGKRLTLSEMRCMGRREWQKRFPGPTFFITGKDRGKLGYFWEHVYLKAKSGPNLGGVINPDSGAAILDSEMQKLTALDFTDKLKVSEALTAPRGGTNRFSPLWQADRTRLQRMAPIEFIGRYMRGWFDFAIADELHQLAGDTAQGNGLGVLGRSAQRLIALTGTLMGGYADDLFNIFYRMEPRAMVREGFAYGGQGRRDFQEQYGVLETIEKVEETDNACSRATKKTVRVLRKPGASPLLFGKFLMSTTAFLSLEDISDNLPRYDESVISVEMDDALQQAYEQLEEDIRSAMKAHRGNKSLMSILLNTLLLYPDHPYDFDEIWARAFDPQTKEYVKFLVTEPENLTREALYAKERALIADVKEELRQGRRCQIYATYTGEKDVTLRLETVLRQEGNHDDALQYEERMHEYAEDDEENREQYEFPEVEKALPECIQKTLTTDDHRAFTLRARRLLLKHMRGKHGSWIKCLRTIERLSRVRLPTDVHFREDGGYDTIPLPSLLVAFKEHDAVVACFDEESQYMLEGSAEPTLGVIFSPQKPDEVRRALRVVGRFIALNHELFQLVEILAESEKCHAGTYLDRREPSLRAA